VIVSGVFSLPLFGLSISHPAEPVNRMPFEILGDMPKKH
jgi:hypothetical protein